MLYGNKIVVTKLRVLAQLGPCNKSLTTHISASIPPRGTIKECTPDF